MKSFSCQYHNSRMQVKFVLFVTFYLAYKAEYNNAVIFKFTNFVCEDYNTSWIQVHQCRLKAVKRNHITLNFNATLLKQVNQLWVQIQLLKNSNGYKVVNNKANIDVCRFMEQPYDPIAIIIFGLFRDFSNFHHPCPFMGNITVKDFYLRSELIPLPIPTGDYLLILNWNFNKKPQRPKPNLTTKQYFTFVEDV